MRAAFVDSAHSVMWGESVRDKRNRKVVTDTGFSEKWIFLLEQVPRGRGLLGSSLPDASRRHDEAGQRFRNGGSDRRGHVGSNAGVGEPLPQQWPSEGMKK